MQCLTNSTMEHCKLSEPEKKALEELGYWTKSMISEGTYSLVYLAEYTKPAGDSPYPTDIPVKVALKVMETKNQPKDFVERQLPRELTIHSRISYPHIIHLHSIVQTGTKVILATRYAERGTLLDHVQQYGELREKQAKQWFRQLALAVSYLHALNLAHRDIKCENILITCNNNIKLCDFGFSRRCQDSSGFRIFSRTHCGSLAYAAPELILGLIYDPKLADNWSLGVVLYVMLNGCLPFPTESLRNLIHLQLSGSYRFRRKILMRVSAKVVDLVKLLLEPNWEARFTTEKLLDSVWLDPLELTKLEEAALKDLDKFNMKPTVKPLYVSQLEAKLPAKKPMTHVQNHDTADSKVNEVDTKDNKGASSIRSDDSLGRENLHD